MALQRPFKTNNHYSELILKAKTCIIKENQVVLTKVPSKKLILKEIENYKQLAQLAEEINGLCKDKEAIIKRMQAKVNTKNHSRNRTQDLNNAAARKSPCLLRKTSSSFIKIYRKDAKYARGSTPIQIVTPSLENY